MKRKLTEAFVKSLPAPTDTSSRIHYDSDIRGFGCRVTQNNAKTLILNYSYKGIERRMVLARWYPDVYDKDGRNIVELARMDAAKFKNSIVSGRDPVAEQEAADRAERGQYTFAQLAKRYQQDYVKEKTGLPKRKASRDADKSMLDGILLPRFGRRKLSTILTRDIDTLMEELRSTPYRANRCRSLLSGMFAYAISLDQLAANPITKKVRKYAEVKREFMLDDKQDAKFRIACDQYPDQTAASAVRLLYETGSRKNEVLCCRWEQFHFEPGPLCNVWVKPPEITKQAKAVFLPLTDRAVAILTAMGPKEKGFVFPGKGGFDRARRDITRPWVQICKMAGLTEPVTKGKRTKHRPILRLHDLRHSYASFLASSNVSLPKIGELLGHSNPQTTARYSHISLDAARAAANVFGSRAWSPADTAAQAILEALSAGPVSQPIEKKGTTKKAGRQRHG
jgi:integrase